MVTRDSATHVRSEHEQVKQCCARLYESDLTRFLLGDSFHPGGLQMTAQLGRMLGLTSASRVLDVACGKGTTAVFLAKEFGCDVFGVDYGDKNVEAARSLARAENAGAHVQFERSDAESLPFSDGSFDAVICECAFCTFPDKAAAAREFFRVLRRGGHVGIGDLTRAEVLPKDLDGLLAWIACIGDAQTVKGYVAYLQEAGFSVDSIEQKNDALKEMVDQVRMKLLGAEIMAGLNKLQLPGIDLGAAKRMASGAMAAVKQGQLGYVLISATKPAGL
ncbi:MAG: methyltransferase domain-containing protein [Candidatus Sulfotelmatobacter sp.]